MNEALPSILILAGCVPIFFFAKWRAGKPGPASEALRPLIGLSLIACSFLWLWATAVMLANEHRFYFSVAVMTFPMLAGGVAVLLFRPTKKEPLVEMLQPTREPEPRQPTKFVRAVILGAAIPGFVHAACLEWVPGWSDAVVHFCAWLHLPGMTPS